MRYKLKSEKYKDKDATIIKSTFFKLQHRHKSQLWDTNNWHVTLLNKLLYYDQMNYKETKEKQIVTEMWSHNAK